MRIDGVSPNRPAYNAGIKKGDIIVGLGKHDIEDIYSYMEALGGPSRLFRPRNII